MSQYLKKILLEIPPYIPGRSLESIKQDYHPAKVYKLASNENPLGPSPKAVKAIKKYLKNLHHHVILILDEAYREFNDEYDCLDYTTVLQTRLNVLFLRTLSKGYGLSGLRVGYLVGHSEIIADVNRVREVFNVNALALVAAEAALDDEDHLKQTIECNENGKRYLSRHLKRLGYQFQPTSTNFLFVNTNRPLPAVEDFLLRHGIIVRPMTLNGMANGYIRVSIGRQSANRAFIQAMEKMKNTIAEIETN